MINYKLECGGDTVVAGVWNDPAGFAAMRDACAALPAQPQDFCLHIHMEGMAPAQATAQANNFFAAVSKSWAHFSRAGVQVLHGAPPNPWRDHMCAQRLAESRQVVDYMLPVRTSPLQAAALLMRLSNIARWCELYPTRLSGTSPFTRQTYALVSLNVLPIAVRSDESAVREFNDADADAEDAEADAVGDLVS